jgi:hypothetical protein
VDGDDAAARLLVPLHRGLLLGVPRVAGRLEHDQRVVLRQVGVVEDRRVLGVVGLDARLGERRLEHRGALRDRLLVPVLGGGREDEDSAQF